MEVLFICTGNTCRSPMAEALARSFIKETSFFSRGIAAWDGEPASLLAKEAMLDGFGIDISGHVSKALRAEDVERADLILTMTKSHRMMINNLYPNVSDKLFMLRELAGQGSTDVSDPYGGDSSVYKNCAEELVKLIRAIDFSEL